MANPYLRPDELPRDHVKRNPGAKVLTPDGKVYFFAGEDGVWQLMAKQVLDTQLDLPYTRIEYGVRSGSDWLCERVVKRSVLDDAPDQ
jgi:hypothetical protein